jgi:hypothetical protein
MDANFGNMTYVIFRFYGIQLEKWGKILSKTLESLILLATEFGPKDLVLLTISFGIRLDLSG